MSTSEKPINEKQFIGITLALTLAVFLAGLIPIPGLNWIVAMLIFCGLIWYLGFVISKRASGILIDKNNKMRLSRFQLVVWTIIVLTYS